MQWSSMFAKVTSDGHIPCGILVFAVGSVLQWFHRIDGTFVAFTTTVLGFLGGHAYMQSKDSNEGK